MEVRKVLTAAAMVAGLMLAVVVVAAPANAGQQEAPDFFVVEPDRGQNVDDELGPCGNRWNNTGLRWRTAHYPHFTLCHGGATERDIGVVERALRRALRVGRTKYGVRRPTRKGQRMYVDVFMYPREAGRISKGYAFAGCCHSRGDRTVAEIHAMTPSLMSDWPTAKGACYSNVFEEAAATYTHEMIHIVQMAFDFDLPTFVTEGLAQYDAYAHGTPWARTTGFWNNFEYAGRRETDNKVISWSENLDRSTTLGTEDVYYGGLVLMKYYADRDGESVHRRFMHRGMPQDEPRRELGRLRRWYTELRLQHPGCRSGDDRFDPRF
ncbi:MAG: hypothetical protein OXH09_19775 [Gammaproteobacteria bacterium]|nr:hypothetical protein [Gammaproteobacteria bacterium]MCY4029172.1 hypothetical protein [Acidobacteriota bacterium]